MNIRNKQFKNKVLIVLLLLISLFTLTSCKKTKTIDNVIAIGYLKDDIYLINSNNECLLLEGYDLIQDSLSNYMYVRKDNKYGYIDIHGKEIIEPTYTKAYAMNEGKAVVISDGKYVIINSEGKKLYTLPNNIVSNSYFSNNKLLVEKAGKYGYITFNPENNSFNLPGEFIYDYASAYSEGFAVVGLETQVKANEGALPTTSVKFNYLDTNNKVLFPEYQFDEAEPFKNGLAKAGVFTEDVAVSGVDYAPGVTLPIRYYDMVVYNYIKPDGSYLIDQATDEPLECHYGIYPYDGVITTAITKYFNVDGYEKNLFKSYSFYTTEGEKLYESCFTYSSFNNTNVFWPTNMVSYGPHHFFAYGKQSISWSLLIGVDGDLDFTKLPITVNLQEKWVNELSNEYFLTKEMVKMHSESPFYVSDIFRSAYAKDTRPLMITQISFNNNSKYGIIQFNYDEELAKEAEETTDAYSAYYIIPPIYDRIVF